MSKRKYYSQSDFETADPSPKESQRVDKVIDTVKAIGSRGEFLTEVEKDGFGMCIISSNGRNGFLEDFGFCDDFKFKLLYRAYHENLAGGKKYYKLDINKMKILELQIQQHESINTDDFVFDVKNYLREVSKEEAEADLNYLNDSAEQWRKILESNHNSNDLLRESCKECRSELDGLNNLPIYKDDSFYRGKFLFKKQEKSIILRHKFLYLIGKEVLETFRPVDFQLLLNGKNINITSYSIIHILSRHFAGITHQYNLNKTYHSEDVGARNFHLLLREIFLRIDALPSSITSKIDHKSIYFEYKGIHYRLFTKEVTRTVKGGVREISYTLKTFFPMSKESIAEAREAGYLPHQVDGELSLYLL